ncbi:MAG TPA: hypothetical protein GXX14_08455 [Clostridiaceae bacterium]|nr:hypothetical protein [Clostridiaceae bacterium]
MPLISVIDSIVNTWHNVISRKKCFLGIKKHMAEACVRGFSQKDKAKLGATYR